MIGKTCGECRYLRGDRKGQTACFESPGVPNPAGPVYHFTVPGATPLVADAVYPLMSTTTPACGKFQPKDE